MQPTILTTGATGNIGSKVANELIQRGSNLKVTGRNAEKL
jgi:short-subunit dehydrogenase